MTETFKKRVVGIISPIIQLNLMLTLLWEKHTHASHTLLMSALLMVHREVIK